MMDDFVEDLGYEKIGRINIYLLLPRLQINKHRLKMIAKKNDTNCIRTLVRDGHEIFMIYLDHEDNIL